MTKGNLNRREAATITGRQMKMIWGLARQLCLDSDPLHELVFNNTGKDSIKALSRSDAAEIIDSLIQAGAIVKKKRKPKRNLPPNVVELATAEQMQFIRYLEAQLGWQDNQERLKGFFEWTIKKEVVRTKEEAIKVIEGLKNILARQMRKGRQDEFEGL
jgi:hypothetical protein